YQYIIDEQMLQIDIDSQILIHAIDLYKSRTKTVKELIDMIEQMYAGPNGMYKQEDIDQFFSENTAQMFTDIISLLQGVELFDKDTVTDAIKSYTKKAGIKFVYVGQPLR